MNLINSPGPSPPQAMPADRHPRGPEEIKAARRALGLTRAEDLLALARTADPYYCGTGSDRRDAEWFAALWERFGYGQGVHLRLVHYQVLSTGAQTAAGEPYENTDTWSYLKRAGASARYLGLVNPEAFSDQRTTRRACMRGRAATSPSPR